MSRIPIKKPQKFIDELKEAVSKVGDEYEEHVEPVIEDIIDVVEDVIDAVKVVAPIVLEVVQSFREEPSETPVVEKQSLRINVPEPEPEVIEVENEVVEEKQCNEEFDTLELEERVLAFEECLLKISPVAKKPISQILSANLLFTVDDFKNYSLGVEHEIVECDDKLSFMLFVKNNRSDDLKIKINYHVMF